MNNDESLRGRQRPKKFTQDRKRSTKTPTNTHEGTSQSTRESSGLRSFISCVGECCLRNINVAKSFIFHSEDDDSLIFRNGRAERINELPTFTLLDNHFNNTSKDSVSIYCSNGENSRNHKGSKLSTIWSARDDLQQDGTIEEVNVKDDRIIPNDYTEEVQMNDINLQSEKETQNVLEEKESNVLKHVPNKHIIHDIEPVLLSAKKKSSILDNVPKMETIPEGEQFSPFPVEVTSNHTSSKNDLPVKSSKNDLPVKSSKNDLPVKSSKNDLSVESANCRNVDENTNLQIKSSDTIPMYKCDSWNRSSTSFHVKIEDKVWADDMTDISDEILLEALKKLHEPTNNLWMATIGDADGLRRAISKGVRLNDLDHLDRTVLHLAVGSGSTRAVRLLLENGLDPNAEDGMGRTSLHYATINRPSLSIARLLFEYGARIPQRKCSTDIGLFLEFITLSKPTVEDEQLMKLLIQNGSRLEDPNAPGGRQALHYAAMYNNSDLIRALAQLGADINVTNRQGMTPSDVAIFYECREAQFCLEDISISNILVDNRSSHQMTRFSPNPTYFYHIL